MNKEKTIRQYISIFCAIILYYIIHEGAHLFYALYLNVFKQIRCIALGIQIDVYVEKMSAIELGIFCIIGSITTVICAYIFVICSSIFVKFKSKLIRAILYYVTIAMLFLDPIYLSVLHPFVGGGDMNGISLLINKGYASIFYGVICAINILLFCKIVLAKYSKSFQEITLSETMD